MENRPKLGVVIALIGLPLLVAMADWAWTQGAVKYKNTGVNATYQFYQSLYDGDGNYAGERNAWVNVTESEAVGSFGPYRYYQLQFDVSVHVYGMSTNGEYGYGYASGYGEVPAEAVASEKPEGRSLSLRINTDTLDFPFYKYKYGTIDVPYPDINLNWRRTNEGWNRWEGHQVHHGEGFMIHSQGNGSSNMAQVVGSITLPEVPDLWGDVAYVDAWIGSERTINTFVRRGPPH